MPNIREIKAAQVLLIIVILNLVLAVFIVSDYGRSTDEANDRLRSALALKAYTTLDYNSLVEKYDALGDAKYYGTASSMVIRVVEKVFFPKIDHSNSRSKQIVAHYFYFIYFQAAIIGIFFLAKNFLNEWVSLSAALLFGTQPLLFGHAFMNPKDIPLLAAFLITVVIGFQMVDNWLHLSPDAGPNQTNSSTTGDSKNSLVKRNLAFFAILLTLFIILWTRGLITESILNLTNLNLPSINDIDQVYKTIILSSPLILIALFYRAQTHRVLENKANLLMLLAAASWGFAMSIRFIALAAGGLVGIYALIMLKKKAVVPLLIYTLTASVISYLTWPYLWVEGLPGFYNSLVVFSDYPWGGSVLFEGQVISASALPVRYFPKLMLLQFSEPLIILAFLGFVICLYLLWKNKTNKSKLLLVLAWFFLPLAYVIVTKSTSYNNFRQYLFITPPLFILAGFSLQQITSALKKNIAVLAICLLFAIPGFFSIVQNHPFQYIYYNAFAGGVDGAYGSYDFDYYNLSYKVAMDYVNENLPEGSKILIWKDNLLGKIYAEKRLKFYPHGTIPPEQFQYLDYAIMPSGRYEDLVELRSYPVIFSVKIQNSDLVDIIQIRDQ